MAKPPRPDDLKASVCLDGRRRPGANRRLAARFDLYRVKDDPAVLRLLWLPGARKARGPCS